MKTFVKVVLVLLALAVVGVFGGVWAFQNYAVYSFEQDLDEAPPADIPDARFVSFQSFDGETIHALLIAPQPDRPVILSFYGNGANLTDSTKRIHGLADHGYGIAMMEYRSSGATRGKPSEANLVRDAAVFYDRLDDLLGVNVPPERRVLHGFSLGAGVGSKAATERPYAAVVLEASPYRTCQFFADRYRGFPFCNLMWAERYDVVENVRRISAPKLIVHGARDEGLPVERARQLYEDAPGPKEYVEIPEGGHADLNRWGLIPAIDAFISRHVVEPSEPTAPGAS